jgi:predicted type IV restriction endonuclease
MPLDKEQLKLKIQELITKLDKLKESGKSNSYTEEDTKKGFIEPLFKALGWNFEDKEEVSAEERISKNRVDYALRINGIPKLFIEAKAIKEDLVGTNKYHDQAISYAWHKGCNWAVLTDFEELLVFNAEWESKNILQSTLFNIYYTDYLKEDNLDKLLFLSRDSLEKGELDKYAESIGKKTKRIPIDKQLLGDLTTFRDKLTQNIQKNTKIKISENELDEAVQRIIDRLIFIRTLEDRTLEPPMLRSIIRENKQKKTYTKLIELFRKIDDIYNSKLFEEHLCEQLDIDDNVLETVINGLYKPQNSIIEYDFSLIDADVLGNIYEQYLGHILKKTEKSSKLLDGKTHRKEQGIYYTPTYIVDYIVKNTMEKF